jgi:XTP/dITP diphosphohydrolase
MHIYLATGNAHKVRELRELLPWPGWEWRGLTDVPGYVPPEEDGATFAENALLKAEALAARVQARALADDSGLEVHALGFAPGVRSARYAGEPSDDAANVRLLLERLAGQPDRRARFRCALACCEWPGRTRIVVGTCTGRIAEAPRGAGGFGYDPVFIPEGHDRTFAEMSAEEKNALSHRADAAARARRAWADLFVADPTAG